MNQTILAGALSAVSLSLAALFYLIFGFFVILCQWLGEDLEPFEFSDNHIIDNIVFVISLRTSGLLYGRIAFLHSVGLKSGMECKAI